MTRFAKLDAGSKFSVSCRYVLAGLMLAVTVAGWGCGGKEPTPPPGVKGDTKAPVIDLGPDKGPGADQVTPPADKN